ncbi:hypothetical protein J3L16_02620 [Alteromonas sp. 5E99-2]|uniref:hypothetical protein n=1 Tax=Alteromonas sp. 5E99-2 TaxID=2817683 RepID=UPI001A9934F0|nr:hypothetical protein [Alteromonas sp. 5E99-2]MBO1254578.1 hypothetical protein [Alteromonas sp. 5E99-2]
MKTKKHLKNLFNWPEPENNNSSRDDKNANNSMNNFNWFARYDLPQKDAPTGEQ